MKAETLTLRSDTVSFFLHKNQAEGFLSFGISVSSDATKFPSLSTAIVELSAIGVYINPFSPFLIHRSNLVSPISTKWAEARPRSELSSMNEGSNIVRWTSGSRITILWGPLPIDKEFCVGVKINRLHSRTKHQLSIVDGTAVLNGLLPVANLDRQNPF